MANPSMGRDLVAWLRQQLQETHPELLREMLATMVPELVGTEAQHVCGAEYGEHSSERMERLRGHNWLLPARPPMPMVLGRGQPRS